MEIALILLIMSDFNISIGGATISAIVGGLLVWLLNRVIGTNDRDIKKTGEDNKEALAHFRKTFDDALQQSLAQRTALENKIHLLDNKVSALELAYSKEMGKMSLENERQNNIMRQHISETIISTNDRMNAVLLKVGELKPLVLK